PEGAMRSRHENPKIDRSVCDLPEPAAPRNDVPNEAAAAAMWIGSPSTSATSGPICSVNRWSMSRLAVRVSPETTPAEGENAAAKTLGAVLIDRGVRG